MSVPKKILVGLLAVFAVLGLMAATTVKADSGACAGYGDCAFYDTFDSAVGSGWTSINGQTVLDWSAVVTGTTQVWVWFPPHFETTLSSASGTLTTAYLEDNNETAGLDTGAHFQHEVSFSSPGTYKVVFRAAHELGQSVYVDLAYPQSVSTTTKLVSFSKSATTGFAEYESQQFTVNFPVVASLSFFIPTDWRSEHFYLDAVYVVKVNDVYATLPAGTASPVPMATQIPVSSFFCQPAPTATATPAAPNYLVTPAPTATPVTVGAGEFSKLDTFTGGIGNEWTRFVGMTNADLDWTDDVNHTPYLGWGAAKLRNDIDGTPNTLIIYPFASAVTTTTYLDGWAMSDPVQAGVSQFVEVWYNRDSDNEWVYVNAFQVSHANWYPFHAVITATGGIKAVMIKGERSDQNTNNFVYLDDLYLYNNLAFAPYCNGTYGSFVVRQIPTGNIDDSQNDDTFRLVYPDNKPCPPPIIETNNFWGPLLSQLTIFVDELFAFSPAHDPGVYPELFKTIVFSPVGTIFVFLAILFDWTWPLYTLGLWLGLNTVRIIMALYLIIKRMIPFVG